MSTHMMPQNLIDVNILLRLLDYILQSQLLQYFSIFRIPPIRNNILYRGNFFMFNERLKLLRTANKLSQVDLANKLGVKKQTVSNWENDNILPSVDMLIKICNFFHVSTDYILGLDKKMYIEVSGLSVEIISHIQQIINDIRSNNKSRRRK